MPGFSALCMLTKSRGGGGALSKVTAECFLFIYETRSFCLAFPGSSYYFQLSLQFNGHHYWSLTLELEWFCLWRRSIGWNDTLSHIIISTTVDHDQAVSQKNQTDLIVFWSIWFAHISHQFLNTFYKD